VFICFGRTSVPSPYQIGSLDRCSSSTVSRSFTTPRPLQLGSFQARIFFQPLTRQTSFVLAPICRPGPSARISSIPFYANLLQFSLPQAARPQQLGFLQSHATRNFYSSRSIQPPLDSISDFFKYLASQNFYSFSSAPSTTAWISSIPCHANLPQLSLLQAAPATTARIHYTLLRETSTVLAPSSRPGHYRSDFFNSLPREPSTALAPSATSATTARISSIPRHAELPQFSLLHPALRKHTCNPSHEDSLHGLASPSRPGSARISSNPVSSIHQPPSDAPLPPSTNQTPTLPSHFCHHELQEPRPKTFTSTSHSGSAIYRFGIAWWGPKTLTTVPHSVSTAYRFGA
jgi:hypothetical protein